MHIHFCQDELFVVIQAVQAAGAATYMWASAKMRVVINRLSR